MNHYQLILTSSIYVGTIRVCLRWSHRLSKDDSHKDKLESHCADRKQIK